MGQHQLNRLSPKTVENTRERGYYPDGGGLYLRVSAAATKSWVFRYTRDHKTREMGLGSFADVSLKEARELATAARKLLREQIDPIDKRDSERSTMLAARESALTFEQCAAAYIAAKEHEWKNAKHGAQWRNTLSTYAYPVIGKLLVREIEQVHVLKILEPLWISKNETASRLRGRIAAVLDYAKARGYRKGENPAEWRGHLDKILAAPAKVQKVEHHAALPFKHIGKFMMQLRQQVGLGARAVEFAILTAARSGEVRGAMWEEIDLDEGTWTIPASRMKAGKEHRIPLSKVAVDLLRALPRIENSPLVFPSTKKVQLSDMTLTAVLKRMEQPFTMHGFRSTFRDWAGESTAYPREVIEHALAHQLKDKSEAAYARGDLFNKRRRLMADWAKFCSIVAASEQVTPIRGAA